MRNVVSFSSFLFFVANAGCLTSAEEDSKYEEDQVHEPDPGHDPEEDSEAVNLRVTSFETFADADNIYVNVTVENAGSEESDGFYVDVFVDPNGVPEGTAGDDYVSWGGLNSGSAAKFDFAIPAAAGVHEVLVLVDSEDAVRESNEGDNAVSATVSVDETPPVDDRPNLRVTYFATYIYYDLYDYYYGYYDVFEYDVEFENNGAETSNSFYVDFYADRSTAPSQGSIGDQWVSVGGLAPGEWNWAYAYTYSIPSCGSYCNSWVQLDSDNTVEESNESDNVDNN